LTVPFFQSPGIPYEKVFYYILIFFSQFHKINDMKQNDILKGDTMRIKIIFSIIGISLFLFLGIAEDTLVKVGDQAWKTRKYDDFEKPQVCGTSCHTDIYQQWTQAMMSQAYTHHWDEIEYFQLAVPHAEKDSVVAGVKAGCNGCHSPIAFLAGDTPPPKPDKNSRANESVSCDVCHTITGFQGDVPHNFNYIIQKESGKNKYGPREGVTSPAHITKKSEFLSQAEFCGTCHNEMSPYGVWVKSTHLEWKEGPYAKEGVRCHNCHMTYAPGTSAAMGTVYPDTRQHLFHGAHDPGKIAGTVEVRIHPDTREAEPGDKVIFKVVLFNQKTGHKFPSGSSKTGLSGSTSKQKILPGKPTICPSTKRASKVKNIP